MAHILRPTTGTADWQAALADPVKQWRVGHSAMAAAQSWEEADGLPPEIAALLGDGARLQLAIPEHKVSLPGRGADSQCDVFALVATDAADIALAVEAKVNEPFGPTIADWFRDPSENKRMRLGAICDWLGVVCPPDGALRYQLFHRTVTAVMEARRFRRPVAAMIVQSFSPDARWLGEFDAFAACLGCDAGYGRLGRMVLPDGTALWLGWAQGDVQFLQDRSRTGGLGHELAD